MHRLLRFYNQNRKKVWLAILIVVLAILLVQVLNYFAKLQNENTLNNVASSNNDTTSYKSNHSIISDSVIDENTVEKNDALIKNFITYCNNGEIEQAYDLLTDECKELLFPSLEYFKTNYYNNLFKEYKSYTLQAWITGNNSHTYEVRFLEDVLSTGKADSEATYDYITVVQTGTERKLNISSYVGRAKLGVRQTYKNIEFTVESKDIYIEYEVYNITIKNNTRTIVVLDSKETTISTYLLSSSNSKYTSYIHEQALEALTLIKSAERTVNIKFNKVYSSSVTIKSINFTDLIIDYDTYLNAENEETKKGCKENISISLY